MPLADPLTTPTIQECAARTIGESEKRTQLRRSAQTVPRSPTSGA
jgi:hypothetical protein